MKSKQEETKMWQLWVDNHDVGVPFAAKDEPTAFALAMDEHCDEYIDWHEAEVAECP